MGSLVAQVRSGGRIVIPIGPAGKFQWLTVIDKPYHSDNGHCCGKAQFPKPLLPLGNVLARRHCKRSELETQILELGGVECRVTKVLQVLYVPLCPLSEQLERSPAPQPADPPRARRHDSRFAIFGVLVCWILSRLLAANNFGARFLLGSLLSQFGFQNSTPDHFVVFAEACVALAVVRGIHSGMRGSQYSQYSQ